MRIAIAQMSTRAGDFGATVPRMGEYARRAAEQGADLLVFPAMVLSGAEPVPYQDREGFLLDLASALLEFSEDLPLTCLVPVLSDFDGVPLAEALLVSSDEVRPVRLSTYLASVSAGAASAAAPGAAKGPALAPGSAPLPELELAGAKLGVAFSYEDLDDYDDYDYDVDAIVFLSPYGFATDDASSALGTALSEGRFVADAEASGAWIVGVGSLGCYADQVFCGSSFVVAPWGELAAQAASFEEALLVCDVDPAGEGPLANPLTPEVYDAPMTTWGALTLGLSEAVARAGKTDVCSVVDGSLNSMLLLALATDALGPTRVRALVLERGERALDDASVLVTERLRLPEANVERFDGRGVDDAELARDLAEAQLAALARATGAVPLSSEDKTGLALEPARAVSAARLMPLADLYRSDVVALAHLRNTISPVIPSAARAKLDVPGTGQLADAMPSAELRLEFVDLVLSCYLEWEQPLSDIVAERGHAEAVGAVLGALRDNEALRRPVAGLLAVTSKTLSEGRAPAGLAWKDRVREKDERLGDETRAAIARIQAELLDGSAPGGASEESPTEPETGSSAPLRERDVRDLLGYLRDFSQGGGFSPAAGQAGGRHGQGSQPASGAPGLWEGPFSEN